MDQQRSFRLPIVPESPARGRPFIQVWFRCSRRYVRCFRNARGTGYLARCPKCGRTVRFHVGPGGTTRRVFEVSC